MFTKVHHVTYVVEDVRGMAEFLETNFGLKPEKTGEIPDRKFLLYHIGPTIMDFFEPTTEDSGIARQLKEQGPGVAHVAWGVEDIDQVFKDLKGKGNELRGDAPSASPFGYKTLNIDTNSSQGVLFQLAEGEES